MDELFMANNQPLSTVDGSVKMIKTTSKTSTDNAVLAVAHCHWQCAVGNVGFRIRLQQQLRLF
eukprot:6190930-Pleurochrysis_carterae.AAC.2